VWDTGGMHHTGEKYKPNFLLQSLKWWYHLVGIKGNIILKCMFKKHSVRMWAETACFRIGSAVGSCKQGKGP